MPERSCDARGDGVIYRRGIGYGRKGKDRGNRNGASPYAITQNGGGTNIMGELIHTSKILITRVKGPVRKAFIEGFSEPVFYGVHGGIKKFYGVEPEEEHPATLDHIVAATAA